MKIFRYIILSLCAAADIGLFIFGVMGIGAFAADPEPSVPMAMIVSWTIGSVVLAGLTVWSFYRTHKAKTAPLLYGFLLKTVTVMLVLSATWFSLGIPEAGGIAIFIAALIGALSFALPRMWGSPSMSSHTGAAVKLPVFNADKAKWAWDEAAIEYFRLQGIVYDLQDGEQKKNYQERVAAMNDSESAQIYDYAGTPIAYFLGWLVQRNLVSEDFLQLHGAEAVQAVREERDTPLSLLRNMDYVLSGEDIVPRINTFMVYYYEDERRSGPYSSKRTKYFMDYYRAVCSRFTTPRYYCLKFDWESFHELARILDRRYREYSGGDLFSDDYAPQERVLRAEYFDTAAELRCEPGTPPEYADRCADAYEHMSEPLRRELAASLEEFCTEEIPEEMTPDKILRMLEPTEVVVSRPVDLGAATDGIGAVPAYVILGESAWEPEHGVAFTVIGDCVVSSTYHADAESPWQEHFMWKYRIHRDALNGDYCMVDKIPADFGGSGDEADRIRIPLSAALCKKEMDLLVEALYIRGFANKYECKVTYDGDTPNYLFISTIKGEERTFADSIPLT